LSRSKLAKPNAGLFAHFCERMEFVQSFTSGVVAVISRADQSKWSEMMSQAP
jgi:hypothetical protein